MNIPGLIFHVPNGSEKYAVRFECVLDDYLNIRDGNACFEMAFDHVSNPIAPMGEWIVVGADDYAILPTIIPVDPDVTLGSRSTTPSVSPTDSFSRDELSELKSLLERMVDQSIEMAKGQRSKFDLKVRTP